MLYLVTHAQTPYNERKLEDGWAPALLNQVGRETAAGTAHELSKIPMARDASTVWSSDIPRALQMAHVVAHTLGLSVTPTTELRTLDTGRLVGEPEKMAKPLINHFLERPDLEIPEGESVNTFGTRVAPFLKEKVESPEPHIAATHSKVALLATSLAKSRGRSFDFNDLKEKSPLKPGGIMLIHPDWTVHIIDPR